MCAASRSATRQCAARARHVRGARLAGRHRLPDRPRRHRGRAAAGACRRHRTPARRARPGNYWGYNTIGFFAPDPRFLPAGSIAEFKTAVKRLHEAGIEVILDVVYNHTGEGNQLGPTLSFRGIDNLSYYRLQADRRLYQDVTGTGNTLNVDHPRVLQMVLDSLRYWVEEMHVDGFRFDLCTTLGRENGDYSQGAAFFDAMRQDPVMAQIKLIAEPWDVGPVGYQLGNFPPGWAEWNGQYRDGVRRFWKGDKGLVAEMASRLAGSSDIFGYRGRRPWASINFITAHDGFTLQDLVSYEQKHNEANGEDNRDGHDANFSLNGGVEGPTDDPAIVAFRDRQKRNLMATLLLSLGVPMLLAGDELGRTQHGNNNAYCQDNELSWLDWENVRPEDAALRDFVRYLIQFRRTHRVFSRPRFFRGEMLSEAGLKDITWVTPAGIEATDEDWGNPVALSLGYVLCGAAGEFYTRGGQRDIDESFLVMMNAYQGDLDFHFPAAADAARVGSAGRYRRTDRPRRTGTHLETGRSVSAARALVRAVHQPRSRAGARSARRSVGHDHSLRRGGRRLQRTEAGGTRWRGRLMRRHHRLPFGAEIVPEGVRFRLWAPRATGVSLVLEGGEAPGPIAMRAEPDGWWSVTTERGAAGSRYRYRVDGGDYPDPASRYQPDGVHGASEVVDPGAYEWSDTGWRGRPWEEIIIYELHIGTFSESGDFAGAISRLDDLVALGVTAVELMPIAQFPGRRNWGYDGVQYYAPACAYGRPEDLKALVEACHARGLAILLDVVYNHFGPEGNYLHVIGPDFFTERHHTPWGAAINYDGAASRPVRDFMIQNALYWLLEYHFDGLRLDAVHAIIDDSDPDILTELARDVRERIAERPVHLVLENDANEARRLRRRSGRPVGYTAQWNDDLHHVLHVLATGRTAGYYGDFAKEPIALLGRALTSGFVYQGEPSPYRGGEPRGEPSGDLPPTAFVAFLQNHDQIGNTPFGERITDDAPEALVHAALAIVLLAPQIPLLFMGEEWATARPFMFFCDFESELAAAVREGRRREFAQFAEFGEAAAQGRIPDATAESSFGACRLDWSEREREPHRTWFDRYRRMLQVRREAIMPRLAGIGPGGAFRQLGPKALRSEWTLGDSARLLLLANFGDQAAPLGEAPPHADLLYCTLPEPPRGEIAPGCAAFYLIPSGSQTR